jgi:ABC-type antimicrobial peptide transport system permease subunit
MTAVHAGAAALYVLCAVLYYRGRFGYAAIAGALFFGALAPVVPAVMGPVTAALALALLAALPVGYLVVHVVDARYGIFLLPTVYSIPIAFVCALALWVVTGLALLF